MLALPPQEQLAEQVMEFAERRAPPNKVAQLEAERKERLEAESKPLKRKTPRAKQTLKTRKVSAWHVAKFQNPGSEATSPQSCADQERAIKV